jgi:hypothetical protein
VKFAISASCEFTQHALPLSNVQPGSHSST